MAGPEEWDPPHDIEGRVLRSKTRDSAGGRVLFFGPALGLYGLRSSRIPNPEPRIPNPESGL